MQTKSSKFCSRLLLIGFLVGMPLGVWLRDYNTWLLLAVYGLLALVLLGWSLRVNEEEDEDERGT